MAVANQPWRRYGSTGEMLMELLKEANGWLRDSLIASGCTEAENSGGFNQTWSTKFAAINAFAERYLRSITTARLKARVAAILIHEQQDVAGDTEAPETNYDKLQTALKAMESLSRMAATDFLNMGRSDHMPDLRKRLSDIDGLVKDELSKKAEEIASTSAPEIDATSHDTAGVSQGPLEVDEAWLQPPDGAQKHCNATPERSREKATGNTEERRPHTPDVEVHTRKRELALLSPGPHSRPAKRPSREDLSESVDFSRQSVKGEDIWGEHKPDDGVEGEEADDLNLEGRARSVQAFSSIIAVPNSVSSTERRTGEQSPIMVLLPLRVVQGHPDDFDGWRTLPLGENAWHCFWVSEKEIESSSSDWGTLKLLPGVRIVRKFQGNLRTHTPYRGPYYEIAICDSYKQRLVSHGFQLRAMKVQPDDWTVPSDIDVYVYGRRHAEQMVADCADEYTRYASKALESGLGPGLEKFYRRFAPAGLRVVVEWIIIMRQLLMSKDEQLERFAQCCVALSLSLLQDRDEHAVQELILRDLASCREFFRSVRGDRLKWPPGYRTVELHDIAVLSCIMEHCGFQRDSEPLQHCFDYNCSAEERLERLGSLLEVGMGPCPSRHEGIVKEAFSQAKVADERAWNHVRSLILKLIPECSQTWSQGSC